MLSLIKKDIITSITGDRKQLIKYIFIFLGVYLILNAFAYSMVSIFISYLMLANTFYCDYENNSRNFIKSMPTSKEDIVYSKYIMGIGLILIITTIITVANQILSIFFYRIPVLNDVLLSVNVFLIIISFVLPMYFKFGYNKVRILGGITGVVILIVYGGFFNIIAQRVYQVIQQNLGNHISYGYFFTGPFSDILEYIAMNLSNVNIKYFNLYTLSMITIIIFILSMYVSVKIVKNNKSGY